MDTLTALQAQDIARKDRGARRATRPSSTCCGRCPGRPGGILSCSDASGTMRRVDDGATTSSAPARPTQRRTIHGVRRPAIPGRRSRPLPGTAHGRSRPGPADRGRAAGRGRRWSRSRLTVEAISLPEELQRPARHGQLQRAAAPSGPRTPTSAAAGDTPSLPDRAGLPEDLAPVRPRGGLAPQSPPILGTLGSPRRPRVLGVPPHPRGPQQTRGPRQQNPPNLRKNRKGARGSRDTCRSARHSSLDRLGRRTAGPKPARRTRPDRPGTGPGPISRVPTGPARPPCGPMRSGPRRSTC